jgi:hypoxanthine phosphoribosyltransferase
LEAREPILRKYGTVGDVLQLKDMALDAEHDGDLDKAIRLWEQVNLLATDPIDRNRALKVLNRLRQTDKSEVHKEIKWIRGLMKRFKPSKGMNIVSPEDTNQLKQDILPLSIGSPMEVQSDGVISSSSIFLGVVHLEIFARKQKPDFIIGVNRGGWLLSTYLAQRLNINSSSLFRFDSDRTSFFDNIDALSNYSEVYHNRKPRILLVDDIVRTGHSIHTAIEYIQGKLPSWDLSVMALIICGKENDAKISYNPYWTQNRDIQLPWSSAERKKQARKNIGNQENILRLSSETPLGKKTSVLRMSDGNGDDFDVADNDIDVVVKLIESFNIPAE